LFPGSLGRAHGRPSARETPGSTVGTPGGEDFEAFEPDVLLEDGQDLAAVIARHKPGDTITLTVLSGGQTQQVKATLSARPTGA